MSSRADSASKTYWLALLALALLAIIWGSVQLGEVLMLTEAVGITMILVALALTTLSPKPKNLEIS